MKILWWSDTYWPHIGGIEVVSAHLLQRLIERGFEVMVVTSQRGEPLPEEAVHENVPIRRFPFHEALQANRKSLWAAAIADVQRLKSEFLPDLVHLNFPSPSCLFHLLTEKSRQTPTVAAIHSTFPSQARSRETLTRRMLGASTWVTANSRAVLADVLSVAPEIEQRSSVIYNGLSRQVLEPSPLPFEPPVIACVARLVENKGIDIALRALALVRQSLPGTRMIVAGDGPELENLQELTAELELTDCIDFLGWVEPGAVAAVIDKATLVLVPSRRTETFGLVAVEAMQLGRPVIVSDCGGLPEVVSDGETGFVVGADDATALAQAALMVLENPELARKFGDAGRMRAESCFSIDRSADEYADLYRRVVSSSRKQG